MAGRWGIEVEVEAEAEVGNATEETRGTRLGKSYVHCAKMCPASRDIFPRKGQSRGCPPPIS
ncbi:uncharacterized protein Dyak_GE28805 [Drosophila yakuba]|uniref:Uncharacterized protein n=1 Tax=Drosophila yakuba TaxID=7245 RepID=A0A0R1DW46_DROYA|nr:uncharacterized protein Dyak_GE28805 [Drosophila yakuba]